MKTLLLMRNGKSNWKEAKDDDKERPLNKKGEKDAHRMGEFLEDKELTPQVILTSTALRARDTAKIFLDQCCEEVTFMALDALYMAEPPAMVEIIRTIDDHAKRVMVVGHNPGLETLLQHLTGEIESMSRASIVRLELPIEHWADLSLETKAAKWKKWKPKDA